MRQFIWTFCLIFLAGSATAQTVGQSVDDFSLQSLEDQTHRASDYRNKVLVLAVIGYN